MNQTELIKNIKSHTQFRNSKDEILKEVLLSRVPNIDEKILIGTKNQDKPNKLYRVYDVITTLINQKEGYIIFVEELDKILKLFKKTKEMLKND